MLNSVGAANTRSRNQEWLLATRGDHHPDGVVIAPVPT